MRKAILILTCLLLMTSPVASQRKPSKPKPKPTPDPYFTPAKESPCGVPIPTYDEFLEEIKVEWRVAAVSKDETSYYNTQKFSCEDGILKVWIKDVRDGPAPQPYSMLRYEFKCRANQLRVTSSASYSKNGDLIHSEQYEKAAWRDVMPETIGESILETVCHKKGLSPT